MSPLSVARPPPRPELIRRIRGQLSDLGCPLRILAENVLGAEGAIDLLAADPAGRAVLALVSDAGNELETLALGLAHRAWVAPRIRDWLQLAPSLALRAEASPRLLLIAPGYDARTLSAVRWIDPEGIDLAVYRALDGGSGLEILLEPLRMAGQDVSNGRTARAAPEAPFRSGLSDADLGLTPAERSEFS